MVARKRELHVVDAGADGLRAVGQHRNVEAGRHPLPKFGQQLVDTIDRVDDVGVALLGNDEKDRRVLVVPAGGAAVAHACADGGDVRKTDHRAVHGLHHHRIVFIGIVQLVIDPDGDGAFVAVEGAERPGGVGIG